MKLKIILLVFYFAISGFHLFPQGETTSNVNTKGINYDIGLTASLTEVDVLMGDDEISNTLKFSFLALRVDAELFNSFDIGVIAGICTNKFKDAVDFIQLPLSLRLDSKSNNSMNFGLNLKYEFSFSRELSLQARGQYMFFKLFKNEYDITLPVVSGTSTTTNSFSQATIALLAKYEGLTNLTLFAGPQFNIVNGKFTADEMLEGIEAEQSMSYTQKSIFGMEGGAEIYIGDHLKLDLRAGLGAKTFFSASMFYIF